MKNTELLRKIYYENRMINRNIQRLANIGLIGLFSKVAKDAIAEDDKEGKTLVIAGIILITLSEIVLTIGGLMDYKKSKIEEEEV